ncbi:MAG: cytochrome P460 family protein [Anaerolineae bacterium]
MFTKLGTKLVRSRSIYFVIVLFLITVMFIIVSRLRVFENRASNPQEFPEYSSVRYPEDFRTTFQHYATVQRPDGTIRDIYINVLGALYARSGELPSGTIIVIESYHAKTGQNGDYLTDSAGHYIKGEPLPMIHVREKRIPWAKTDFVSNARNGDWNSGSFDRINGEPFKESLSACFHCHSTAPNDFLYSFQLLQGYSQLRKPQYLVCRTTGRTACE